MWGIAGMSNGALGHPVAEDKMTAASTRSKELIGKGWRHAGKSP